MPIPSSSPRCFLAEVARVGYFNQVTKSGSNAFHGRILYLEHQPRVEGP